MTPTQFSAQLRRIATAIDNSKQPSKQLVMRELRRVVAALGAQKAYRVILDEPVGVCVGFVPNGVEYDEWNVVSDDGGSEVGVVGDQGIVIAKVLPPGISPLGPDISVWRSEDEFERSMSDEFSWATRSQTCTNPEHAAYGKGIGLCHEPECVVKHTHQS